MKDFFKTGKFKVIIVILIAVIAITIYGLSKGETNSVTRSVFNKISEPFQQGISSVVDSLKTSVDMIFGAKGYYEENVELKEKLNEANKMLIDYDKTMLENEELRNLLELSLENDSLSFSAPATIIARTTNDPYGSFVINKGSDDGVSPFDTVMTSKAVVGICTSVSQTTATVQTLYSPKSAVGVTSVRGKIDGVLEGDYLLLEDGKCRMNYIENDEDIVLGDVIFTKGSEIYPEGQLIGTVSEIVFEDSGLSKYAVVELAVDPNKISTVFVVTDFNGRSDTDEH